MNTNDLFNKIPNVDNRRDVDSMRGDSQSIRILTIQEVSDLLRVHRTTVYRYAQSGELKSYLVGNRRLFKESDVWAFFENQVARNCVSVKEA